MFRIYFIYLVDPVFVFSSEILVELIPKMPYIIRFFRDPFWTLGDPGGDPGGPQGVSKFYQDLKTSIGTTRNGLEPF